MSPEQAARRIAEAMGIPFDDIMEHERQAWIAAVTPVLQDIAADVKAVGTDPVTGLAPAEHRGYMRATAEDCASTVTAYRGCECGREGT